MITKGIQLISSSCVSGLSAMQTEFFVYHLRGFSVSLVIHLPQFGNPLNYVINDMLQILIENVILKGIVIGREEKLKI
jgi:hypothetical protein